MRSNKEKLLEQSSMQLLNNEHWAQLEVARAYAKGLYGLKRDVSQAISWYRCSPFAPKTPRLSKESVEFSIPRSTSEPIAITVTST